MKRCYFSLRVSLKVPDNRILDLNIPDKEEYWIHSILAPRYKMQVNSLKGRKRGGGESFPPSFRCEGRGKIPPYECISMYHAVV